MNDDFIENDYQISLSVKRLLELWDKNLFDKFELGTFKGLSQIHSYMFKDVFNFNGQIRKVNISKNNFMFCLTRYLEQNLKLVDSMKQNTFDQIIDKYVEMNICHPYREGNGRSTRLWLDQILKKQLKVVVNWTNISKEVYFLAMYKSTTDSSSLKLLIQNNLTTKINDRNIYIKSIIKSYEYEGFKVDIN
ncbi:cell filamentation protein Fic [Mycoplasma feriruminatoris]|uniref:protein adenylyltransferase Fic n=1 Tax=Mycoplasma feriruminatoris TaxID=1179777 RepID=UPI00241ECF54|nr:Fic family protein [Mycoplasma feriruminatoris]WFQ91318.1 cell filamentation protein Fic [Mycoplasma feriruminatoris]